ncbi:hypothetical protein MKW98_014293 [Papaver atlanticum]|uniref:RING-type domain-containing protein n=1 Tax=Papaver atlanticum TaxID=357466 RepID=A0AAD4SYE5_9MAGN|nr:hypothetical protein MKW98_014293 [Papaver atlanticum]
MSSSTSFSSTLYTRKLLLHTIPHLSATSPHALSGKDQSGTSTPGSDFDANVLMVLSVLICGLICALGLNSIIRFAILSCSNRIAHDLGDSTPKLAHTGIKKKALKTFSTATYSIGLKLPSLGTECVICISEFSPGEKIRILPKCNHGFHTKCIDKWLSSHSSCPTCRHCLIETCEKIINGGSQPRSLIPQAPLPPPPSTTVPLEHERATPPSSSIVPLEQEGVIRNAAGIC